MIDRRIFINTTIEYLIYILFFVLTLILIWSLNKGFDLSDEGLYLALSNTNVVNLDGQFNYDLFFKLFYQITNIKFDIINLRILKLILLLTVFLLYRVVFKYFKIDYLGQVFVGIGLFSSYTLFGQSLSYNTISFLFVALFNLIIFRHIFIKKSRISYFLTGSLSSLVFFSKSTVGLLLLAISIFLIILELFIKGERINKFGILFFLFSFCLVQFIFQLLFDQYSFLQVLENGVQLSERSNYYNRYSIIKYSLAALKWTFCLLLIGFLVFKILRTSLNIKIKSVFVLIVFILGFLFFNSHSNLFTFRFREYLIGLSTLIILGYYFGSLKFSSLSSPWIYFILFSFLLPLVISFGSNYYFFRGISLYIFFWFLILAIIRSNFSEFENINFSFTFSMLTLSFLILYKVFINVVITPFKQPPLINELIIFKYYENSFIYLEKSQAKYLNDLRKVFDKHIPIDSNVTGLYQLPGDILIAGRQNFYNPCIWESTQYEFYKKKAIEKGLFPIKQYFLVNSVNEFQEFGKYDFVVLDSVVHYSNSKKYLLKVDFNN